MDQRRVPFFVVLIPMAALVTLIFVAIWMSFRTPGNPGDPISYGAGAFPELYGDLFFRKTIVNTAIFALVTVGTSLFFGTALAWLVERTNLRFKELLRTLLVFGLLIPGFLSAMGWVLLLHPRIGVINTFIRDIPGFDWFSIDISHPAGMGFVQGLGLSALVFIMVSSTFRAMNPALEEAASIHGLGFFRRLRRITLPLSFPGILAAGIYISSIAIAAFDVPAIIGIGNRVFTFSTYLWIKIYPYSGIARYDIAGAFGILMLAMGLLLLWWYFRTLRQSHKYVVVTGKAYRPRLIQLGRWKVAAWGFLVFYFLLAQILPILILIWNSMLPYLQPISLSAIDSMGLDNYRALPWWPFPG
jgi:iron(III) transport system permease protein